MHGSDDRGRIGGIAVGVREIGSAQGEIDRGQEIAFAEPHRHGHDAAVAHGIIGRRIFQVPAVFHGGDNFGRRFTLVRQRDHLVETSAVR